jgi:hypothetical protein
MRPARPFLAAALLPGAALLFALLLALLPWAAAGAAAGALLTLVLPGHALRRCLAPHERFDHPHDLLHSVAASLAVTPVALRLAFAVLPFDRARVIVVMAGVTSALLLIAAVRTGSAPPTPRRAGCRNVLLIAAAVVLLLAPGLAVGTGPDGGETRVKGWDLNNHLAIARSIAARGLPPENPFLESDAPFYYHAFFHLLLGAILAVAGEGARGYLLISLLLLLLAAVFLAVFHRTVVDLAGDGRGARFATALVALCGGFDLIPMAGKFLFAGGEPGSPVRFFLRHWNVDGWVSNQGMLVPSVFATFYWAPHAVAALTVLLLALRHLRGAEPRAGGAVLAGIGVAAMAGYNGYVALGGALVLAILGAIDAVGWLRSRPRNGGRGLVRQVAAGALGVLLALPVLHLYLGGRDDVARFRGAAPGLLLPVRVFLEFGPPLVLTALALPLRRRRREEAGREDGRTGAGALPFVVMAGASLPIVACVASTGENNDLAMRLSLLVWVGLAAPGGAALARLFPAAADPSSGGSAPPGRAPRLAALAAVGAGVLAVAWFAAGAALDKPVLPADEAAACRWAGPRVPPGRPVQGSPLRNAPEIVYLSGRPAVLSDNWTGRLFYADPVDFARRLEALRAAFTTADPAQACAAVRSLGIAALVVGPPERRDFPRLEEVPDWPCVTERFESGDYRAYRIP